MKKILSLLAALSLFGFNSASAVVPLINVNYTTTTGGGYTGKAVIGYDGDQWNTISLGRGASFSNTTFNLINSSGSATGVSVTTTGQGSIDSGGWLPTESWQYSGFHYTSYVGLMDGYLFAHGSNPSNAYGTITFSGLASSSSYDVYIYTQGDTATPNRQLGVTVDGIDYTTTPSVASASTFIEGQNYLKINALTDASGNLAISYNQQAMEANINGIQIAGSVPEPGTVVLLGIGGIALAAVRKRNANETTEA